MTALQLRHALRRLGLSQLALARRVRVHGRTVRSWVLGQSRIPYAIDLVIECWQRHGQPTPAARRSRPRGTPLRRGGTP